ncbi:SusC/RagA family TonB-linked outer membrane protein [Larkinella soli]|uniref:SusC/RagA family TonB-linked outer membrane protein n=1 Tax=Larkinella soli TaxID=1770527 RepID=UPI0013E3807C|nr:TonB-dependent receptor [Larkinella soli]
MVTIILLTISSVFAQTRTVRGRVIDEKTNTPLPGANVMIAGTTQGTTADANGNFTLSVPTTARQLVVSFVGYVRREIALTNAGEYAISLASDEKTLQDVVVIGYGSRERKDVTGAISNIKADEIAKSVNVAPELALQGRLTGVQVTQNSGNPNSRPTVRIRGVGTFGNAEPLYVIDGIPLQEYGNGTESGLVGDIRGNVNILTMLNPGDIESVSVLKDAAASAVYGVRAAHGVILITTKRGRAGKPRVEVNAFRGVQNLPKTYDMLNVQQLTALTQEAYKNNPNEAKNLPAEFDPSKPQYLGGRPTVDWQTPGINKNAVLEDYSVRVSGGSENTNYYVSGGFSRTEGVTVQNNLKRYSLAASVNSTISKYLSTGVNYRVGLVQALDNFRTDLGYLAGTTPWQPIYDPNGPYGFAPAYRVTFKQNPKFVPTDLTSGAAYDIDQQAPLWGPETNANPYAWQQIGRTDYTLVNNIGSAFVQLEPLPGLRFKGTLGVNWFYNRRNEFHHFDEYLFSQTPGNPYAGNDGTSKGSYGERHARNLNLVKEFSVNFVRAFGDHRLDLLVNASEQRNTYEFISGSTGQLTSAEPDFRTQIGGPIQYVSAGTIKDREALIGYLGRVSYNYAGRYYIDATLRRDGSSKFAPGYKWGTFPGVAVAWRVSGEKFMQSVAVINDLKLRAGWGRLGNDKTRAFAYLSSVSTSPDYAFGSGNGNGVGSVRFGASLPDFPNVNLSWETAESFNVGVDATLLRSITITMEYYNKLTKGILQSTAIPSSVGNQNDPIINIASVRNSGVELALGYNKQFGAVGFNASANLTTVKNNVVSVFKDQPFGGEGGRIEVGYPLSYLWGYKVGGVFQTQAEIDQWKGKYKDENNNNNFAPGDMYFQDVYGNPKEAGERINASPDNIVNSNDRTFIGKTIPGYFYGLNLGANWKGFDLSVFFQGIGDVQKYNSARAGGESMAGPGNNYWTSTLNRWTGPGTSTTMPRAVRSDPAQNNRFSDRFVEDAGFARLKNLQIGYTLPKSFARRLGGLENGRIYLSGTNLLTLTNWTGLDPENDAIPPARSLVAGINLSF